jgi:hypothetical protein
MDQLILDGLMVIMFLLSSMINMQSSLAQLTDESSNYSTTTMIKPINHLPIANNDSAITNEDTSVNINVMSNDTDPDGDSLNITGVTPARNGTAKINETNNNIITYSPSVNFFGTDSFDYIISDNNNGTASSKATVTVSPLNDKPLAVDDKAATNIGVQTNINVLGNDTDPDGDSLNITGVTPARNGTAKINETTHTIIYTPNLNFIGTDIFSYMIFDGNKDGNNTGAVTVTVNKVLEAIRSFAPPNFGISPDAKSFLTVFLKGPSSIEEDPHAFVHIIGKLGATNGTGISDQEIFVKFYNQDNPVISYQDNVTTDRFGRYEFKPNDGDANLPSGRYIVYIQPTADEYKGRLNATKEFIVEARPSSIPPEIWAPLYGLIPAFLIPAGVSWFNGLRQRKNLSKYRKEIEETYDSYERSHKERLQTLDELQRKITEGLEKGSISESHYGILKNMISEVKDKIKST